VPAFSVWLSFSRDFKEVCLLLQKAKSTTKKTAEKAKLKGLLYPAVIFVIILTQLPFLLTIVFSSINWNLLKPADRQFVGLKNYATVFSSGDLVPALVATITMTTMAVVSSLLLGLLFALLLDRKFKGRALARTLIITPFLVMPAAAALSWKFSMFDTNIGAVNYFAGLLGLPEPSWITDYPMISIVIVLAWQFTPFMMLILLAGLQSQDQEVLEAAAVDGSSTWKTFQLITMPHLRVYFEIAILLGTIILLQVFDPIAILTKGTGGTKTLSYLLYERAFIGLNVGEAAAYGVIVVIITIVLATLALRTLFTVFTRGVRA
jgi:sorbitol/mannitol transport system permease protein